MGDDKYTCLKLESQLCFPLYACSKEIIRRYKPYLDELDLTYTQYITMMVLWERGSVSVKELGEALYLDSGTLTPLLKKMEECGWLIRCRCKVDERVVYVSLTDEGWAMREKLKDIPEKMGGCVSMDPEDAKRLYELLYQLLNLMSDDADAHC